jgi:translation initiation factor 1
MERSGMKNPLLYITGSIAFVSGCHKVGELAEPLSSKFYIDAKRSCLMGIEERSTLVFASGIGRIREEKPKAVRPQGDGVVRIMLKRLGGGKTASVVTGIPLDEDEMKDLARSLKQKCGVGGSVKDFCIEIQGDKRNILKAELEKKGYTVKLAGG